MGLEKIDAFHYKNSRVDSLDYDNIIGIIETTGRQPRIRINQERSFQRCALNLPDEFRTKGVSIVFSARAIKVPNNVRLACIPIRLTEVKKQT